MISTSHTFSYNKREFIVQDVIDKFGKREPIRMKVKELEKGLNNSTWFKKTPSISQVLPHMRRIEEADLSYPLLFVKETERIIDGNHRLCKAILYNVSELKVILVSEKELMDFYQAM